MTLDSLLSGHSSEIGEIVRAIRSQILDSFPDCVETFDHENIGFGFAPGYKQLVFVITPHTKHVNLGIARGASIEDPDKLMTGTGKIHRHVKLHSREDVSNPALDKLIAHALQASRKRLDLDG